MRRITSLALILVPASAAVAQPDPEEIVKKMDAAITAVDTISFTFHRQAVGSLAARSPDVTGSVAMQRIEGDDELGWRIALAGERTAIGEDPAGAVRLAYDGDVLKSLDDSAQIVNETTGGGFNEAAGDASVHGVKWLLRWQSFVSEPFGVDEVTFATDYEGTVVVDGVECHVVFVDLGGLRNAQEYDIRWFVGVEDSLPHRYDAFFYDYAGAPNGFEVVTLSDMRIDDPVLAEAFTLESPEGYEVNTIEVAAAATSGGPQQQQRPAGKAPNFTLTDTDGKEHTLKDYRGQVVVLDFCATWCGPCVMVMPQVQALHEKFKDDPVTVFGVNCWESGDMAAFMKEKGFDYLMLLDGDSIVGPYGISGIPTFYVIGVDGQILLRESGASANLAERVGTIITRHLAENANE